SGLPLIHRVIGDAIKADFPIRPRLDSGPFDALRLVLRLAQRPDIEDSGRATRAAAVDTNARVAVWYPFFRINYLPALILVSRAGRHVRVVRAHALPLVSVELFKVEPFTVRAISQKYRILANAHGTINIATHNNVVIHADWQIPINS